MNRPQAIINSTTNPHQDFAQTQEPTGELPDGEGLSGQGSASALAYLREMESKRADRTEKAC